MSGLDLAAIRTALADQIRAGIDSSGFTVSPYPSTAPLPTIEINRGDPYVEYFVTMGPNGLAAVNLVIEVHLSGGNAESEAMQVDEVCSMGTGHGSSIPDAVMNDRTLGGTVDDAVTLAVSVDEETGLIRYPVQIQVRKQGAAV